MHERKHPKLFSITFEMLAITSISLSLLGPAAAQSPQAKRVPAATDKPSVKQEASEDLSNLLPFLLTSPDRKRLAENLEAFMRDGNLQQAEESLNAAVEVGTLAIVLADHLHDANLLATLQGLGIRGDAPSPTAAAQAAAPAVCPAPPTPVAANLADMQQALEKEKSYSTMVSQTMTELMQEHNTLAARLEMETNSTTFKTAEMEKAIKQEQERRQAIAGELSSLQDQYRTLQESREQDQAAVPAKIADLQALLQQERNRGEAAQRQLASAREELRVLQASQDTAAAAASRVAELEDALAQAKRRGADLQDALADAGNALRRSLERKNAPVMMQLAATEPQAVRPSRGWQETAFLPLPLPLPQPEPVPETKVAQAESASVASDVTSALPLVEPAPVVIAALPNSVQPLPVVPRAADQTKATSPSETNVKAPPPPEPVKVEDRLMARADELFRKGDVSAARLLLERSMEGGNAQAAFLLAETFDPHVLSKRGVLGIRGDAAKARELYGKAQALGVAQAAERIEALKQ